MSAASPAARYDVVAVGRSSIDLYAHEIGASIADVRSFDAYLGGCPTNVSVGTRRLGLRPLLLTAVGDDQVADFILGSLEREGVETRFIPRKPGRRTSAVILTIQPPDRFPLTFYRDNCADRALTPDDVARAPIAASGVVFVTGTGLSHEPGRQATLAAAHIARAAGVPVVVDLDYRPDQWERPDDFAREVQALARSALVAIGTEEEIAAATLSGDGSTAIATLLATGVRAVVMKLGARGATVFEADGGSVHVEPFPVDVLNVLGAGDAFASGFLYGFLRGWPLERAARLGNACGAIVVTRHGCANFMPTLAEVSAFMAERGVAAL